MTRTDENRSRRGSQRLSWESVFAIDRAVNAVSQEAATAWVGRVARRRCDRQGYGCMLQT